MKTIADRESAPRLAGPGIARRLAASLAVLLLTSACGVVVRAPAVDAVSAEGALASWTRVLDRFVDERGEVDFTALAADPGDLERYVRHIADTPVESIDGDRARRAHLINAYNALSIFNVVRSGVPATHAGFAKVRFFVLRKVEVGGRTLSLRAFENDVIRPDAVEAGGDPRIHFALNCSAVACPRLPRRPFSAAGLDAELERETRAFFARPENFRVDVATRTVWLSELLAFYPEDFVPRAAPSLLEYASRHAPASTPPHAGFGVRFTPYDWTISDQRRPR